MIFISGSIPNVKSTSTVLKVLTTRAGSVIFSIIEEITPLSSAFTILNLFITYPKTIINNESKNW